MSKPRGGEKESGEDRQGGDRITYYPKELRGEKAYGPKNSRFPGNRKLTTVGDEKDRGNH